jgi:hypothetical protein
MKSKLLRCRRAGSLVLVALLPWLFASCTGPVVENMAPARVAEGGAHNISSARYLPTGGADSAVARAASRSDRPGLATGAGHDRWSVVEASTFYRRNSTPDAAAKFHYNDDTGAKTMAELHGKYTKKSGWMKAGGDRLKVALVPLYGSSPYPRYEAGGESIVIGKAGQNYAIHLKNLTNRRLEVVASVDGLNVLSEQPAGTGQRGYVLEPKTNLRIEGFRINNSKVKTFRFGAVGDSVAAKKGMAGNVGVVGLAVFEEDVVRARKAIRQEQNKRLDSEAFPVFSE